jgi:hypothetical protein
MPIEARNRTSRGSKTDVSRTCGPSDYPALFLAGAFLAGAFLAGALRAGALRLAGAFLGTFLPPFLM